ncbi:MAG TPA: RES domain-containing protein [Gemmatimonadaceae bacterium]|nr:RES domain-containing protein [Gemmatimonadaceae bacterium]
MTGFAFGPDAGLPAGYARCAAGTVLYRGHTPGRAPDWFGPALGAAGTNRFDAPMRRTAADAGVCYLAERIDGVLLERVLRGVWRPLISRRTLGRDHALATARVDRDLVLLDLLVALSTVHGLELADVSAPPIPRAVPPYPHTQALAAQWAAASHPVPSVDGIVYGSRFGPAAVCVALWDRARGALAWGPSVRFEADMPALAAACERLGIGLVT